MTQRTRVRVLRSDGREWASMAIAYRELLGTTQEIGSSEHQRIRSALRSIESVTDRHGFTWKSVGGFGSDSDPAILWTDFTFGVELEVLAPMDRYAMQQFLLSHNLSNWMVVPDASLAAVEGYSAMEIVSPVLQGEDGIAKLTTILKLLEEKGCRINSSCGMHVHIGVRSMKVARVRKIAIAFLNAEHCFDQLVPPSRRANRYCNSNTARVYGTAARATLLNAANINRIAEVMNGGNSNSHYNSYRYHKLNFQSFVRHGTIEFRQHAGTVEHQKAVQWVRLITGFCAWAASAPQQAIQTSALMLDEFLKNCTDETGATYMKARAAKLANPLRRAA